MDSKKKEKKSRPKDSKDNECMYYMEDPCGCYTIDPCGCYMMDPCCCC